MLVDATKAILLQPIGRIDFGDLSDWLPDHSDVAKPADAKTPRS